MHLPQGSTFNLSKDCHLKASSFLRKYLPPTDCLCHCHCLLQLPLSLPLASCLLPPATCATTKLSLAKNVRSCNSKRLHSPRMWGIRPNCPWLPPSCTVASSRSSGCSGPLVQFEVRSSGRLRGRGAEEQHPPRVDSQFMITILVNAFSCLWHDYQMLFTLSPASASCTAVASVASG